MNRNFGKLVEGQIEYAPNYVVIGDATIFNPHAEHYAAAGYLPVITAPPSDPAPSGYHYEPRGWEIAEGEMRRVYAEVADPPAPPRRWSRLSIKTALAQAGMLAVARWYMQSVNIGNDYTVWEALTDCDYVEEGYPDGVTWDAILNGAAVALGKTRAEIDAFLASIPTEGV